jgi:hypothetical protein
MFEQIHYSLGLTTIMVLLVYFSYINLGLLLLGSIGLFAEKVTKIRIPSIIKIMVGYASYTSLAWWLYKSGNTKNTLPIFFSFVFCIVGFAFLTIKKKNFAFNKILFSGFLKKFTPLFVIQFVLILFWVGFLNDKPYHILVSGNNDVYCWGFMSDHVMGISNLERIDGGEGFLLKNVIDCFGVYSWLGLIGKLSMKRHSIEAMMIFQLSLSVLLAWLIYEISVAVIGVTKLAAFVPAFVFSFNPLWVYVFTNNFLSQMVATLCLLSCIYILGLSEGLPAKTKNNILAGYLLYVCFVFSYPGLLLPYIVFVVLSIGVFNYFLYRARGCKPWKEMAKAIIGTIVGISLGALMFYDLTSHAIGRFAVLSSSSNGWPLAMLDPLNLIGLISYSLDGTVFSNWISYILLTSFFCFVFILRNRGIKERSFYEARFDSLLFLSVIALIGYLGVYFMKGDGYQQWKFATYFPLPLLIIVVVNYYAPRSHVHV